jgi:hypothetical protein
VIAETIARLQELVPTLKLVGGAAGFQKASETNPAATPAAFVFLARDVAGPNPVAPDVHQRVDAEIAVVLVIKNISDAQGNAASQDMETLRREVKAVLLGWPPATGYDALERGPGNLLAFRDGHLWWQDIYKTAYYDRSVL